MLILKIKRNAPPFILLFSTIFSNNLYSQTTPNQLAKEWVKIIERNSTESSLSKMRKLIHPQCQNNIIDESILKRMVSGPLPKNFSIELKTLSASIEQLQKIYKVIPTKQLSLKYNLTSTEPKTIYGLGKAFPIALYKERWYFVVCLK